MKNYIQPGEQITVPAPYDVASGAGALVGSIFGVAFDAALSGADVVLALEGVYEITALTADTASIGAKVYWDNSNKRLTTTSSGNTYVGVFTKAKTNQETTATVRLNGSFA